MKQALRERLNALNLAFYEAYAGEFSDKRTRPWPGFTRVLERVETGEPSVLDIGCGNGRLVTALTARFAHGFDYLGVDASAALLEIARARHASARVRFVEADFVAQTPERALPQLLHDCVCLFGVLHHVPGEAARHALLASARARVAQGGLLAFTLWRFESEPRFLRRRVPRAVIDGRVEVAADELEAGDALLRWGEAGAIARYCHSVDEAELGRLLAGLELDLVDRFRADGTSGALNDYLIYRTRF